MILNSINTKKKKENPNSKRTLPIAIKSSFLGRTKANK
jgi:hypothetical protein